MGLSPPTMRMGILIGRPDFIQWWISPAKSADGQFDSGEKNLEDSNVLEFKESRLLKFHFS